MWAAYQEEKKESEQKTEEKKQELEDENEMLVKDLMTYDTRSREGAQLFLSKVISLSPHLYFLTC